MFVEVLLTMGVPEVEVEEAAVLSLNAERFIEIQKKLSNINFMIICMQKEK